MKPSGAGPWVVLGVLGLAWLALRWQNERTEQAHRAETEARLAQEDRDRAAAIKLADKDSLDLARVIRRFYPFARRADNAADVERDCFHSGKDKALCAAGYFNALADARMAAYRAAQAAGGPCGRELAIAEVDAIDAAIKRDSKTPKAEPLGVDFAPIHASYRPCSDRLFRYKIGSRLMGPPTTAGAATYLGVKDDEAEPGPIRPGLCTLNGTPIDDQLLAAN